MTRSAVEPRGVAQRAPATSAHHDQFDLLLAGEGGDLFRGCAHCHQWLDPDLLVDRLTQVPRLIHERLGGVSHRTPLLAWRKAAWNDMQKRHPGVIGQWKQRDAAQNPIGAGREIDCNEQRVKQSVLWRT